MAEGYLPRLSDRLMNESLLATAVGPEYGVRQRLDPPQSMFMEMAQPDRGMSFLDRFKSVGTVQGGMELAANLIGGPSLRGIRAFHGSPHKFDRFSMDKIGSGEGAQAYGHGLYFAENEAVARGYRDQLSDKLIGGKAAGTSPEHLAAQALSQSGRDSAIRYFERRIARGQDVDTSKIAKHLLETNAELPPVTQGGHMYEVNIRANPEQFLDWDRPLSQQPQAVAAGLERLGIKADKKGLAEFDDALLAALQDRGPATLPRQPRDPMGQDIYRNIRNEHSPRPGFTVNNPSAQASTAALREAGIPGIKYLDQGSRSAGEGSSNYVVFDDSIIDILKRYGLAGGGLTPLVAASQGDWSYAQ